MTNFLKVPIDPLHENPQWRVDYKIEKYLGEWDLDQIQNGEAPDPYEVIEGESNLLTTLGAGALWAGLCTGLSGTGLFDATHAMIAVGDASTAATTADTDMGAAQGSSLGGGINGATNATPIVLSFASAHGLIVGQVVTVASVGGNTNANGTWEISVVSDTTHMTLLNSAGNSAYTSGGTAKLTNKYRKLVSGAPTLSTNQAQFVAVFATTNANHQWLEWGITTGGSVTNLQATPPPVLLNHSIPGGGLGTKSSAASWTFTVTISLS